MRSKFFAQKKPPLSYEEYIDELLIDARRIREISPGMQRYSGAQFEIALLCFGDIDYLNTIIDEPVDFSTASREFNIAVGFDWLDLSVGHGDEDAINYFQNRLLEVGFSRAYEIYKSKMRPDCNLIKYDSCEQLASLRA